MGLRLDSASSNSSNQRKITQDLVRDGLHGRDVSKAGLINYRRFQDQPQKTGPKGLAVDGSRWVNERRCYLICVVTANDSGRGVAE